MTLWQEFISLEPTSTNLVPTLKALLRSQEDLKAVYKLTGLEAQKVVDSINQAINSPRLPESLRKGALHVLCKLCGLCQLLPTECLLGDKLVETGIQIGSGGFADVWQGTCGGMQVAIKRLRVYDEFTKIYKRFCREVVIWKRLSHPSVLPLLGISTNGNALRMVSKLMSHGNIMAYLRARPSANRLLLLAHVGEGLSYLHDLDLVHGDLKGANILVDDECMPRIADFGLMSIMKDTDTVLDTHSSVGGIGTPRWSAPELLDPPVFGFNSCRPSKKSDCYSLGMTIYEVLTGKVPFHDVKTDAVMMRIIRGIRPERPRLSHAIGFTDPVWTIIEGCWKEHHSLRPGVPMVARCLATAAAQWTPTPPLDDDPGTADESEPFSLITLYSFSENTHTSDSITPRGENPECDDGEEKENRTVAPPYYSNTVAENLHELAERFYCYYQKGRNIDNLDWAIRHEQEAAFTYLHTNPGRLRSLTRLAGHYYERHEISQDPCDIKLSIEKSSDVERRTTIDDPIRPDALFILAKAHHVHYGLDPQQENLEAVIKYSSEATSLYPGDHPARAEILMVLSTALYDRYQASLGQGGFQPPHNDLDDAISNSTVATGLFPLGDPRLPHSHTKLSTFLFARYQRQKGLSDLRQSVHYARLASADLTPDKRPESLVYLGHLLTHLSHDSQTLAELAQCSREALDILPPSDSRRAGAIHNLVVASHRMYVTLGTAAHLDEAINHNRQLLCLLPHGSGPRYSQLQLHHNLLEYRLNERQLDVDFAEMTNIAREIAEADSQSYYDHCYSAQPPTPPPSTSDTPPNGPSIANLFEYRPTQHWSPRPYYYDDSAVSVAGSAYATTDSVETGAYGSGSELSLIGHTMNLSFIEPDPGHR